MSETPNGKKGSIAYAKQIVRLSRQSRVINIAEFHKAMARGKADATSGLRFGTSCHKLTQSVLIGYRLGWRTVSVGGRFKNIAKKYYGEED